MPGNVSELKKKPDIKGGEVAVAGEPVGQNLPEAEMQDDRQNLPEAEIPSFCQNSSRAEAQSFCQNPSEAETQPFCESMSEAETQPSESLSGAPTAMLIRIFGKKDREPYGDIVHYNLKKPVPYQGAAELVLRVDAISRSLDLSGSGNTFRSIRRPGNRTGNILPDEYRKEAFPQNQTGREGSLPAKTPVLRSFPESGADTVNGPSPKVRDTIYLQLIGRQHTSIQGRIWGRATKKKYISFRSALELIYLLSEAI